MDAPIVHELQALGVEFTPGDWANEVALTAAIAGCTRLFLNLIPNLADFSSEVPHARRILAIARAAGVRHVIYSSGLSVQSPETRALYDPDSPPGKAMAWKREVEELVKAGGFAHWTILRGGFFMTNLLAPRVMMYPGLAETHVWTMAYTPETRLPLCDTEDIAKFAVAGFQDPARFDRKEISIASESWTPEELMAQLAEANGKDMRCRFLTEEEIETEKKEDMFVTAQLISRDMSKSVDIEAVKSWGIPLGTFKGFLKRESKAVKETYP